MIEKLDEICGKTTSLNEKFLEYGEAKPICLPCIQTFAGKVEAEAFPLPNNRSLVVFEFLQFFISELEPIQLHVMLPNFLSYIIFLAKSTQRLQTI